MIYITLTDSVPVTHTFNWLRVGDIDDTPFEKSTIERNIIGGLIGYTYGTKKEHKVPLANLSLAEKTALQSYCALQTTLTFKIYDGFDNTEIESYSCIISSNSFKNSQTVGNYTCELKVQEI